ncbi:hypothetical protein DFA_04131 [Cavenderia fasciculata]|uniref:Ankyrin repeat-containing protein n=1 Tax=Cavenderia fasciculata TaxID=261658 RepID=F4Q1D5_CACFS|nr:uncharacterized protein DFA_04131 [Cavenderia fasciculata]EGG18636.1 hypothetical protein DFA_04131 [Cavenderia fasciculata]|eukprot:XP_004366540.1 hypothetical protein DFA_04131 [Cavenderia fasciculata]
MMDGLTFDNNNNNIIKCRVCGSLSTSTMMTIRFKSLIGSTFIRHTIFRYAKELNNNNNNNNNNNKDLNLHVDGQSGSLSGKDIINLSWLEMISVFAMPWNFIKHYLPDKYQVLVKRRMAVFSRYCAHRNATLSTLQHLLEWSPEYDPQDQYDSIHHRLIYNVASKGHRDILEFLRVVTFQSVMEIVAKNGHLHILEWFHYYKIKNNYYSYQSYTGNPIDNAKSLKIVQFLHKNGFRGTAAAIDNACLRGDLDIVKFLFENRTEGCTQQAIINACRIGNFEMIKFILSNIWKEKCPSTAVDAVIGTNCSLEVLMYLDQVCTIVGLGDASSYHGRLDIIQYYYQHYPQDILWTQVDDLVGFAAMDGHLDILQFICEKFPESIFKPNTMDIAVGKGKLEIVKFLHFNRSEGCTTMAMDNAALNNDLETVEFLHKHRTEGSTCLALSTPSNKLIPRVEIEKEMTKMRIDYDKAHHYYEIVELINQYYGPFD